MLEPRSSAPAFKWRRTAFTRIDGAVDIAEDDWSLMINGMSAARIYRVRGGPHDGRWFWTVQIGAGRVPFNSGTGNADGGRQAREGLRSDLVGEGRRLSAETAARGGALGTVTGTSPTTAWSWTCNFFARSKLSQQPQLCLECLQR